MLLVGADLESSGAIGLDGQQNDNSEIYAGAAYLFRRDETTGWAQERYIKAPNATLDDQFGFDVEMSADGTDLVIAAPGESSNASGVGGDQNSESLEAAGAVYLY